MAGISLRVDWPAVAPLRSLAGWFASAMTQAQPPLPRATSACIVGTRIGQPTEPVARTARLVRSRPAATRPLRVLRIVDGDRGRAGAGRMVISGRLADVCAELDRLAALEAG